MEDVESLRKRCWDKAFFAFGTARVFERRAEKLRRIRTWLLFLGIAGPLTIGGVAMSFDSSRAWLSALIAVVALVLLVQLIMSAWGLVARWDEQYESAVNSVVINNELFNGFSDLARGASNLISMDYAILNERNRAQEVADSKYPLTSYEKRYAMRLSLIQFQRECEQCRQRPQSINEASDCVVCGNLKER
ncbi:mobilome CxxCx(11)CxxC protein [Pseudomonas sp. CGJS7]|uniref:mobilome CxxCx(11)CxxC protein n=1 Tax=Pseudomonas sp. CGJS7 TaxID=3109348 RepID=UPI003009336B